MPESKEKRGKKMTGSQTPATPGKKESKQRKGRK
jgi:hypothetical protein